MRTDVLVIGAGPAGAVAARVLAKAGARALLVDDIRDTDKVGESLPGAARPLLRDLGLLPWLAQSKPRACVGNVSAWGDDVLRATDFIRDPNGSGWHVDRQRFEASLRDAAQEAGATWRTARLKSVTRDEAGWQVQLSDGALCTRWLIDASGRSGILARKLGVARTRDTPMIALYAIGENRHADERTMVESVEDGWWYCAPLPQGRRIAVLHVEASDASRILHEPHGWLDQLAATRHIRLLCPADASWCPPRGADAGGACLQQWSGDGWLAVGDAALAFDPLSSQGMFNALYTGLRGAQAVMGVLSGQPDELARYSHQLSNVRQTYLRHTQYFYAAEQRWKHRPFWRRRHAEATQMPRSRLG
ncbi:tryptophan 7-halogenase [Dyella tabacisoli]|uniref:Oxidoreductase n=1 Tax=Dyella tabacisoli TaxID=2282381 RepID=A0A369UPD4_9GAMM|nr:tryptophan 7-halogenase [Dyella tabacisoli]RDD81480.1 oxidoreductase [Dyella tabacisoli]